MRRCLPWLLAVVLLIVVVILTVLLLRGDLPQGRYETDTAKHPWVLEIDDDSFVFECWGSDFPCFRGKCVFVERNDEYTKVLGITGLPRPAVIFFRIPRLFPVDSWFEFSLDDREYFSNGWEFLEAAGIRTRQPGTSSAPGG